MKGLIAISLLLHFLSIVSAQYPYGRAPDAPSQQDYPQRRQVTSYQEEAPSPDPRQVQRTVHQPAPVHYVNIGPELQGDYKFGYDTGKGDDGQSFREETRLPDGTVQGSYGYVDGSGRQRIVKYTAGKDGFKVVGDIEPAGSPESSQPSSAPAQPSPRRSPTPQTRQPAPQPQQRYNPQPAPQQRHNPQPAPQIRYGAPQQTAQAQRTYSPEQGYAQQDYNAPEVNPIPLLQTYEKRPTYRPQRYEAQPQYQEEEYDIPRRKSNRIVYSEDINDISDEEVVVAPIDTSLLSYNIGASQG